MQLIQNMSHVHNVCTGILKECISIAVIIETITLVYCV